MWTEYTVRLSQQMPDTHLEKAMPEDIQQNLGSHDPYILFLQLLSPSAAVPVIHIHVTTIVGDPQAGVLAQYFCLLYHGKVSEQCCDRPHQAEVHVETTTTVT